MCQITYKMINNTNYDQLCINYDLCFDKFKLSSQIALLLRCGDVTKRQIFEEEAPANYHKFKIFNIKDGIGEGTGSGNLDFEMGKN